MQAKSFQYGLSLDQIERLTVLSVSKKTCATSGYMSDQKQGRLFYYSNLAGNSEGARPYFYSTYTFDNVTCGFLPWNRHFLSVFFRVPVIFHPSQ